MAELNIDGAAIAPGVVETIVSLAAQSVDGVASVGDSTTSGILSIIGGNPSTQGVDIQPDESGDLGISLRLHVENGHALPELAADVRKAVADAVSSQVGMKVASVDVYIDGIQFGD